jgi:3-oxoacyl-[acyl-carrier protein] reductase
MVTGATRGIGLAIAETLALEGAVVSAIARTRADVEALGTRLHGIGIAADLMTPEGRHNAYDTTRDRLGPVEILVNNFGGRAGTSWTDTGAPEFELAMEGNVKVAAHLTSLVLPDMVDRGWGRVVVIASLYGLEAGGAPAYNAAKAAEIGFVASLGKSLLETGVTANAIAPGPILYDGGSWERRLRQNPEAIADFIQHELPAGRFGTPLEVANVVCFICSNEARGINGACVPVDGAQSRSQAVVS